ncbi:hypothetical protein MKEN_01232300 [Mycena kentingensis (nom. inval.)]|nr:hypothetical protein MKEN_01232300 [Mycena kentingensis (nom. inval.)]
MTSTDLAPRRYQEEILCRAQEQNVIAALDTGAGKTFISLLLIKWISATRCNAKTIFLVPKAALVQQQGNFIASNSSLRVALLQGITTMPFSNIATWNAKLDQHDVVVMTPQILVNLLTHGLWPLDKISLLVFDECHHTQKNHPYNVIMREYFQLPPSSRPKIFGMTASPVWRVKKASDSLTALEISLDAKIVSVQANIDELESCSPKAVEIVKMYSSVEHIDDELPPDPEFDRNRYTLMQRNLGAYCASLCLSLELSQAPLPESIPLDLCSPKLRALIEVLLAHTNAESLRCIVFVERRQTAACLALILPRIPELAQVVQPAVLFAQDKSSTTTSADTFGWARDAGLVVDTQTTIQAFRDGNVNLVIATAVAEEGLDFPACNLVIRFDPLHHMIGYVQSRGRARAFARASTFVVMIEDGNAEELARYKMLAEKDPELKAIYQTRRVDDAALDFASHHPKDIPTRERHIVQSTGAVVTYDNARVLLGRLCAFPRESVTESTAVGEPPFQATLTLPASLCLAKEARTYTGPAKHSKQEAKRAVAIVAIKRLLELRKLDDHLLPAFSEEELDVPLVDVDTLPKMLRVLVHDPWTTTRSERLWLHQIYIGGKRVAGLVTGTRLPATELDCGGELVNTDAGELLKLEMDASDAREMMFRHTRECFWHRVTSTPITHPLTFYVVPLDETGAMDIPTINRLISYGKPDIEASWSEINESHYGRLLVININLTGHKYLLQRVRTDLSPLSVPPPGSPEAAAGCGTYHEFWVKQWTGKPGSRRTPPQIPTTGPLVELKTFPRLQKTAAPAAKSVLFPLGCCRWINLSEDVRSVLHVLPPLYAKLTAAYRARQARECLGLPGMGPVDELLIEALTLPCANQPYDNQRLETLGDAVLQICTSVHLFNKYPFDNEGQLTNKRSNCVSNRFLLGRAKEIGLEAFLTSEALGMKPWLAEIQRRPSDASRGIWREFPKRSLQECMESMLGAAYMSGGIENALRTGLALGLNLGGIVPWELRYKPLPKAPVPAIFSDLEDRLGYSFNSPLLLLERLEFLGDAIVYMVIMDFMYRKFPKANPDQLAWPRTRAVAAPAQAMVAVKRLKLHRLLLVNDIELSREISKFVPILEGCSGEEIIYRGWQYDPPKALADVFESVVGAILVDTNFNYIKTAVVVEGILGDILPVLNPHIPRDPITELIEWAGKQGCQTKKVEFRNVGTGVSVYVHDVFLCGPSSGSSMLVAKQWAAADALKLKGRVRELCTCRRVEPGSSP